MNVPAENFPFCTLEPNVARVPVPVCEHNLHDCNISPKEFFLSMQDKRYDQLVKVWSPKKQYVAVASVTFVLFHKMVIILS